MELKENDYIGLFKGVYSRECDKDPIKFLAQKDNIWYGAVMAIFYPEIMEWDIVCSLPVGPTKSVSNIFFNAAFYGDTFSIVDSLHGICEDCEVERFEIRSAAEDQAVYVRAIVKVREFIPYDYEKDYLDDSPTDILKNIYYANNPVPKSWQGNSVQYQDINFGPLILIGLGPIKSHFKQITLESTDKDRFYRNGHFSIYFGVPVYGILKEESSRVLASLNSNMKMVKAKTISTGNSSFNIEDIVEEDKFIAKFGPYEFGIENAVKGEVYKIIDIDDQNESEDENIQIYCIEIHGRITYKLNFILSDDTIDI